MSEIVSDALKTKTRKKFYIQAIFGTSFTFLTSGVFLSGLAIFLNAGDLLVNYISVIANIAGISIIFFSSIIRRGKSLKKTTLILTGLSRAITLIMVFVPLLINKSAALTVFIPCMAVAFALQAQTTVVLNNWLVNSMNNDKRGVSIAIRQTIVLIVTVALSLAGGALLDNMEKRVTAFLILFSVALVMSVFEFFSLLFIPNIPLPKEDDKKVSFFAGIKEPIKNKKYLAFLIYIFLFYLFLSVADSFTFVYMMRYLNLSYIATTGLQLIITLPQIFLLTLWGKLGDKKGHKGTLFAAITFFIGEVLFMALSNPTNVFVMIPIGYGLAAIGNAGFTVSVFNFRYELMPENKRISYDNFFTATVGLAFILGPIIGGAIKQLVEHASFIANFLNGNIRFLYLLSAVALTLLQITVLLIYFIRKKRQTKKASE